MSKSKINIKELLSTDVHFGHSSRKWCAHMSPYIYMKKNGIYIIDLYKTIEKLQEACKAIQDIVYSGQKILFVATKKQAKDIVSEVSRKHNMPYITERWLGGLLTNFITIRKTVKKLNLIDKKKKSGAYESLSKKELLMINRSQKKLEKYIGSISGMTRLPFAIFIIDISREKIALKEAKKLNITTFAMVDTDSNPKLVDYFIPSNDDSSKSISIILKYISEAIALGISSRQKERENNV
ncbi:MAG: 30S ribosomal protein S2 [Candidatus Walczuchella monophlebidarum]